MVAYLREAEDPPRWVLSVAAVVSFFAAMQSWIAIAALGLAVIWLFAAKRTSAATRWVAFGAIAGLAVTGMWLLANTPAGELAGQVTTRVDTTDYTMGEFLARQWRFAGELTPGWLRALAPFALVAGLMDRRTRVPVWTIEESYADRVGPGDLVLARTDRTRDWIVLGGESVLEEGYYRLVAGDGTPDR